MVCDDWPAACQQAAAGSAIGPTVMYRPQTSLPSLTVYDYWTPSTAVQRLLCGAAVDQMKLTVNGDFHEFEFSGGAADLLDTSSFLSGQAGLTQYPAEPTLAAFDYTIIPGHLGQAWLGTTPDQFFTLTAAAIDLKNNLDLRAREFGSANPRAVVPGTRSATAKVTLFEQDDAPTAALYQAARQRSPIPMMLQLGQQAGELFGIYMKSVIPEVPVFEDNETRLQWSFEDCRAQGASDDELYVAFG